MGFYRNSRWFSRSIARFLYSFSRLKVATDLAGGFTPSVAAAWQLIESIVAGSGIGGEDMAACASQSTISRLAMRLSLSGDN